MVAKDLIAQAIVESLISPNVGFQEQLPENVR